MEILLLIVACGFIYFIPSWIAWNKRNSDSVIAVNLFLGWTFIGWVVALAMSLSSEPTVIIKNNTRAKPSKLDDLSKLKNLLDSGALSEDEYNKEKEKILNQ